MTLITKPDFTYVWASGGAVVAPNDTKKQQGWVAEAPPFQYDNWLQNRQDQMLAHINQRGIPAWDGLTNYEAGGLSYVQGSDGKVYKSVAASGPASVVSNPTTDITDTYWKVAFADVGAFLTQAAGDARYTQRSSNLSDLTNVSTARTNLGLDNAFKAGISGASSNLKASATGTNATVTVTADSICLKNASNEQVVLNAVSVAPSLAASGANGLDTGASAVSTWYYVWVIWNGTITSGLLSLSATSPTMPVGYTHKTMISVVRSDSTANKFPISFIQAGDDWQYKPAAGSNLVGSAPLAASGIAGNVITPTYVAVSVSNYVPQIATSVDVQMSLSAANGNVIAAPSEQYTTLAAVFMRLANPAATAAANSSSRRMVLESTSIYWASNASDGGLYISGFKLGL